MMEKLIDWDTFQSMCENADKANPFKCCNMDHPEWKEGKLYPACWSPSCPIWNNLTDPSEVANNAQ